MPLTTPPATPVSYHAPGKVMDPYEIRFWQAEKDSSLHNTLIKWSELAGVTMLWETRYDYHLPATIQMHGTFPDAVTEVLTIYTATKQRPLGRLHPNLPEGPSVLVIENHISVE